MHTHKHTLGKKFSHFQPRIFERFLHNNYLGASFYQNSAWLAYVCTRTVDDIMSILKSCLPNLDRSALAQATYLSW